MGPFFTTLKINVLQQENESSVIFHGSCSRADIAVKRQTGHDIVFCLE